jgi:hypothetical protein
MKTEKELATEILQIMQEQQKSITTLLEHPEWFRKEKKRSTSKIVGKEETPLQDRGLTGSQVDSLDEHTPIHDAVVCDEGDRATTLGTSSELPHEGNDISPWVGQEDSTLGHEEEVASSPCHEVCDDLGVSTPKCDEALPLDDPPLETDIIPQEVHD